MVVSVSRKRSDKRRLPCSHEYEVAHEEVQAPLLGNCLDFLDCLEI